MSQKPVAQKLLIKENYKVLILNEPEGYRAKLGKLPDNVMVITTPSAEAFDLIQVFVTSKRDLGAQLPKLKPLLLTNGLLWVTYPKGTAKIKADINRDSIWKYASTLGLQAVAIVAIDETWSAMRLKLT